MTINEMIDHVLSVNRLLKLFHHVFMKISGTGSILSLMNALAISILARTPVETICKPIQYLPVNQSYA